MRIYTRTGDKGDTGLFGGGRVPKDDARVEAYGEVDELNSLLGVVLSHTDQTQLVELLTRYQSLLFELGGALATARVEKAGPGGVLANTDIEGIEQAIDSLEAQLQPLKSFIMPGGTSVAAWLHLARTVCRRAERRLVSLRRGEPQLDGLYVTFLNRLSDLFFVMARYANAHAGVEDVPWHPRAARRKD